MMSHVNQTMNWKVSHSSACYQNFVSVSPTKALRWRHNDHAGVSNHQPHGCLLNRLFRRNSKKTSKLRVTGLCAGNSPGTGEFPAQMASYAENVSIWWRHHGCAIFHFIKLLLFQEQEQENGCCGPCMVGISCIDLYRQNNIYVCVHVFSNSFVTMHVWRRIIHCVPSF